MLCCAARFHLSCMSTQTAEAWRQANHAVLKKLQRQCECSSVATQLRCLSRKYLNTSYSPRHTVATTSKMAPARLLNPRDGTWEQLPDLGQSALIQSSNDGAWTSQLCSGKLAGCRAAVDALVTTAATSDSTYRHNPPQNLSKNIRSRHAWSHKVSAHTAHTAHERLVYSSLVTENMTLSHRRFSHCQHALVAPALCILRSHAETMYLLNRDPKNCRPEQN